MSTKASSKLQAKESTIITKHCLNCGRLISANHRNFLERKYCSKACSSARLSSLDREIEETFRKLAKERGGRGIECGEVEDALHSKWSEDCGRDRNNVEIDVQKLGTEQAKWRERVRRAGRRVVISVEPGETNERTTYECVQNGKAVEPSFAKGEWSVRVVR